MELSFGEKIKEARKAKKYTQKQLAERINAKHNSVSDWENNKNKPDPDTIELLCGVLDITPNYLLSSYSGDFSPIEKEIIQKYRKLNFHGRQVVDFILESEYQNSLKTAAVYESSIYMVDAAHERTDIEVTDEMKNHDDDIMDDENF